VLFFCFCVGLVLVSERIRAFIAIDIEDPVIVGRIVNIRDAFVGTGAPMKPVEDHNLHLTIRFLGYIPMSLVDDVHRVIESVEFNPFKMKLVGVGAFPSIVKPRVIWVGVREGADVLRSIYEQIERGLRRIGFRAEKEEFVPHVTLARLKGSRNIERVIKLLEEFKDVEIGEVEVRCIRLKQSILQRSGPIYKTLREVCR